MLVAAHNNIEYSGLSDVGERRSSNQDAFIILPAADLEQWHERGHIFLVADGMGAHAVGELASKLAADTIPHIYSKHAHEGPIDALRRAFLETNTTIHTKGQQNRDFEGMGTTTTALLIRPEGAWISHVGDSRAYRVRDGKVEQLSFDHSLVWEMARRQHCRPEDLPGIPNNVIVRSLGPEPLVQVDIEGPHPIKTGDVFVLCSDGLSGPVSDDEIGSIASVLSPSLACQMLIDLANLNGGPDNITCVIVRVGDDISSSSEFSDSELSPVFSKQGPWHEHFPWPMLSLALGILFAIAAIIFTAQNTQGAISMGAFLLAAVALVIGLLGILFQHKREGKTKQPESPDGSPPKVYRQISFAFKSPLLKKISEGCASLEDRIRENDWKADWNTFKRHQKKTLELRKSKQHTEAFRESCLAFSVLTEAVRKNRKK